MVIRKLGNRLRGIFKAQRPRAVARRGAKPPIGAHIVCADLGMTIQAGMSEDLWRWLMERGWREPAHKPDRRAYREIPPSWVTELIDAAPEEREQMLAGAVANASRTATVRKSKAAAAPPRAKKKPR